MLILILIFIPIRILLLLLVHFLFVDILAHLHISSVLYRNGAASHVSLGKYDERGVFKCID